MTDVEHQLGEYARGEMADAISPLSQGQKAALVDRALALQGASSRASGNVVKGPVSWFERNLGATGAGRAIRVATPIVALAAGVVLFITFQTPTESLPTYAVEIHSSKEMRGAAEGLTNRPGPPAREFTARADAPLEVVLRPDVAPKTDVVARAYCRTRSALSVCDVECETASGAVRARAPAKALEGIDEVVLAVGRNASDISLERVQSNVSSSLPAGSSSSRVIRIKIEKP